MTEANPLQGRNEPLRKLSGEQKHRISLLLGRTATSPEAIAEEVGCTVGQVLAYTEHLRARQAKQAASLAAKQRRASLARAVRQAQMKRKERRRELTPVERAQLQFIEGMPD